MISSILKLLAEAMAFLRKRNDDKNAAPIKARVEAQNTVKADDATARAIAERNLEQLRKDASE